MAKVIDQVVKDRILRVTLVVLVTACMYPQNSNAENINVTATTLSYENGDRYVGEVLHDLPNGYGSYYYADGDCYVGEFRGGLPNGHGTYHNADGSRYERSWSMACPTGGWLLSPDGAKKQVETWWY